MIDLEVRGRVELARVEQQLGTEADQLAHHVLQAAEKGTAGFISLVATAVPNYLPSGYSPLMARSLRSRTTATAEGPGVGKVSIRVWAVGRTDQRDVRRIDLGVLRHPLYGNRLHWYTTRVRRGFVHGPFRADRVHIVRAVDEALDEIRVRVERT